MPASRPDDAHAALLASLKRVLRPLAKLMLARNITFSTVAELLKQVMVETADRDFRLQGKAQTDSRISLLTGVHRKDVKRLREANEVDADPVPASVSLGAQLVARWTAETPWSTRSGKPKPLARLASAGDALSFEALVESVSKDIRPRAVLDEWLRLGIAHIDEDDRVVLDTGAFVPEPDGAEKAFWFAHNLHDHAAAATHNMIGGKPPFLERSVYYESLAPASVAGLAKSAESGGMALLQALNREAIQAEKADRKADGPRRRFTFGIYFYEAPADEAGDDAADGK